MIANVFVFIGIVFSCVSPAMAVELPSGILGYSDSFRYVVRVTSSGAVASDKYNDFKVDVFDLDGRRVTALHEIKARLWMVAPSMNHGAKPVQIIEPSAESPSTFEIKRAYFVQMPGIWEIQIHASVSGAKNESETAEYFRVPLLFSSRDPK